MAKKYYIKIAGRPFGPVDADRIREMAANGKITSETEISSDRLEWAPLGKRPEFSSEKYRLTPHAPLTAPSGAGVDVVEEPTWYVTPDGSTQFGPYTVEQLLAEMRNGRFTESAYAWRQGDEMARVITEIPELRAAIDVASRERVWYYSVNGTEGYGPYTVSDLLAFVEQGRASFDALVWRQGENARPMRDEATFVNAYNRGHAAQTAQTAVPGAPVVNTSPAGLNNLSAEPSAESVRPKNNEQRMRTLHRTIWVSGVVALALGVLAAILFGQSNAALQKSLAADGSESLNATVRTTALAGGLTTVALLAAGVVSLTTMLMFLSNVWKTIPREATKTSAGQAIGLLFVPLFNLYWLFIALCRVVPLVNGALSQYEEPARRRNETLKYSAIAGSLTYASLCVGMAVLGLLMSLGGFIYDLALADAHFDPLRLLMILGTAFLFIMQFGGVCTGTASMLITNNIRVLIGLGSGAIESGTVDVGANIMASLFALVFMLYPIVFVFCTAGLREAACQLSRWRSGEGFEEAAQQQQGPRTTLDDILNA